MNRRVLLGLAGGLLGIITAGYVIANATSNDVTLAGIQTALFSSLALMGAGIANKETRFAGYMLVSSAVFITMCVPIAGSLAPFSCTCQRSSSLELPPYSASWMPRPRRRLLP